jgi:hypothetical protein
MGQKGFIRFNNKQGKTIEKEEFERMTEMLRDCCKGEGRMMDCFAMMQKRM